MQQPPPAPSASTIAYYATARAFSEGITLYHTLNFMEQNTALRGSYLGASADEEMHAVVRS